MPDAMEGTDAWTSVVERGTFALDASRPLHGLPLLVGVRVAVQVA